MFVHRRALRELGWGLLVPPEEVPAAIFAVSSVTGQIVREFVVVVRLSDFHVQATTIRAPVDELVDQSDDDREDNCCCRQPKCNQKCFIFHFHFS